MIRALALCLLTLSGPVVAQAPAAPALAPVDAASKLAATVLPREATVAIRLPRFEAAYTKELAADSRISGLEKAHPGLIDALRGVARDEAYKGYGTAIDLLQADVAKLYRARFTPAELAKLIAFFTTSTGQAMVEMSAASSGDTASEFEADRRRRAMAMLADPDEQTKADLTMLIESGLLPKIRAINPEISALSTRRFSDVEDFVSKTLPARVEAEIASFTRKPKP